jgi:lipoprotein NlpI
LAIKDYDKAIELRPDDAITYVDRGIAYDDKEAYDLAIADYSLAIALNPKYTIAYNDRGISYKNKGDYDLAIKDYDRAIELDPQFARAYDDRGDAYRSRGAEGDLDRAIADYGLAIKLSPQTASYYVDRASAHDAGGDFEHALADYGVATRIDPKRAGAYFGRGRALLYNGNVAAAINEFRTAIEINASYAYYPLWLYIAQMRAGQNGSTDLAEQAQKLDRGKWPWPVIAMFLGSETPDRMRAAAQSASSPVKQREQVCEADFYLGILRQQKGRQEEARLLFQSAVNGCPKTFFEYAAALHELAASARH